jgi:hypothetical protein
MRDRIASVVRTAGAWPNVRLVSRRRRESTFHQNRRMHMNLATIGLVIGVGALAGCASQKPASTPEPAAETAPLRSGTINEQTVTATATILSIDQNARRVTLKRPDGTMFVVVAGPEVRNLSQLKKGDVVRAEYRESVAYEVNKAGTAKPGVVTSTDVTRAPLGGKPGASVTDSVTFRMTVTSINKGTSEATLVGPDGVSNVVKVRDPRRLDAVEVGDVVDLTFTEALAISVEKAGTR